MALKFHIEYVSRLISGKKVCLDGPDLTEEDKTRILEQFEEDFKKGYSEIEGFVVKLKEVLSPLKEVDDEFVNSIKDIEEPCFNPEVVEFIDKTVKVRLYIEESFSEPGSFASTYMPKTDVIDMMIGIELEQEYIDLLEKFYPESDLLSTQDIIESYL